MQEQGVSRIVSVKFHKNDEQGPESKGTPLDTPTAIPQVVTAEDSPHQGRETMEVSMAK
jgi:hypothetical protein